MPPDQPIADTPAYRELSDTRLLEVVAPEVRRFGSSGSADKQSVLCFGCGEAVSLSLVAVTLTLDHADDNRGCVRVYCTPRCPDVLRMRAAHMGRLEDQGQCCPVCDGDGYVYASEAEYWRAAVAKLDAEEGCSSCGAGDECDCPCDECSAKQ